MSFRKRTIFILFADLGIGGIQKKILNITDWISSHDKKGKIQIIVLLEWTKNLDLEKDIFLEKVKKNGTKVFYKPQVFVWRLYVPYLTFVLWKALVYKPSVIISFMESYSFTAILIKFLLFWRRIKTVVSYDNVASIYLRNAFNNKTRKKWTFVIKNFFQFADLIVVPSDESKKDLINNFGIPKKNINVNKNWVSENFTDPESDVKNIKFDIIYVGRVDKQKNLVDFIRIISRIVKTRPIKAAIVGWGEDMIEIAKLVSKLRLDNNIKFLGSQNNVSKILKGSKLFLLTSKYEGFPISALEAMACKLPVVTSDYPGSQELVSHGKTGFICKNSDEFVERINLLLNNKSLRMKMGNAAREYVITNHSENNLKKFINLLN